MRYFVIDLPNQLDMYDPAKSHLTFVYESADPKHTLGLDPFFYIGGEDELDEKIELLDRDHATLEEAIRL